MVALVGCAEDLRPSTAPLEVTPVIAGPHVLLLSEVLSRDERRDLIPSDFILRNLTGDEQELVLAGKSCNCYQILVYGVVVEMNESIRIAGRDSVTVRMDVTVPPVAAERTWRSTFKVLDASGGSVELPIALTARVIDDARLDPVVLSVPATESGSAAGQTATARVRHVWRGMAPMVEPVVAGLPEGCQVRAIVPTGGVESLAPQVSQRTWILELAIAETLLESAGLHPFEVHFAEPLPTPVTARGRLLIESRRGVIAPESVHFGQQPVGSVCRRRLILAADDGRSFRVTAGQVDLSTPDPELMIEFDGEQTALRHVIDMQWTLTEPGPIERTIELTTDHPRCPRRTVTIRAVGVDPASATADTTSRGGD